MALQDYPLLSRQSLTLAVLTAALLAGCQPQATNPPPLAASPMPTAPGESVAPAAEETLPPATVDSDLAMEDQAAIENLLDTEALEAYMPSDLINDGGVILYRTMAASRAGDRKDAENEKVTIAQAGRAPAEPPEIWGRQIKEGGSRFRQLQLRREPGQGNQKGARVTLRFPMRGVFAYKYPGAQAVSKPFIQTFRRDFRFTGDENGWTLASVSPIQYESRAGHSGLEFASVAVYRGTETTPAFEPLNTLDRFLPIAELPTFKAGEALRVEVQLATARQKDAFVFAHLVGNAERSRQALRDDGLEGDRVAGDGIYTRLVNAPATAGLRHFGVDILSPGAFTPGGAYRANALGMTFRVEAP